MEDAKPVQDVWGKRLQFFRCKNGDQSHLYRTLHCAAKRTIDAVPQKAAQALQQSRRRIGEMNGLCEKYNVPLACDPEETVQQAAADLAAETVRLLCCENEGFPERMETASQIDEEKMVVTTPAIRLVKADNGRAN